MSVTPSTVSDHDRRRFWFSCASSNRTPRRCPRARLSTSASARRSRGSSGARRRLLSRTTAALAEPKAASSTPAASRSRTIGESELVVGQSWRSPSGRLRVQCRAPSGHGSSHIRKSLTPSSLRSNRPAWRSYRRHRGRARRQVQTGELLDSRFAVNGLPHRVVTCGSPHIERNGMPRRSRRSPTSSPPAAA